MTHVLVTRLDNDGDVLLAGPAIRAVAAQASKVTLLCGPRGRQAAQLLPGVDEVRTWRAPWIDPEPAPVDSADVLVQAAQLSTLGIDRALIFGSFHQSPLPTALLLRLAHVPWIGAISVDYPGSLLDLRHHVRDDIHEVERNLSLTTAAGFPPPRDTRLTVRGVRPPLQLPRHFVVVHPGASVPARAWEPERNAELVEALTHRGHEVVVTGGPGERELTAYVAGRTRDRPRRADDAGRAGGRDRERRRRSWSATPARRTWPRRSGRRSCRCSRPRSRPSAGARGPSRTSCCTWTCCAPAAARASVRWSATRA